MDMNGIIFLIFHKCYLFIVLYQMCLLRDVHRSPEMLESNFLILFCNSENLDRKLSSPVGTQIETTEGET